MAAMVDSTCTTTAALFPLEFQECKVDSPYFRCKLQAHEEALARTSTDMKQLIEELKNVINAEQQLCLAQRTFASHLRTFQYDCIGVQQTDDEVVIANSLQQFGQLLGDVERERSDMLEFAHQQFIQPLEYFRKEVIGKVKVAKKNYEKSSSKFYQSQDKFLNGTAKKDDAAVDEMAAALGLEKRQYTIVALDYVKAIQAAHERKKFEFVETLIGFVHSTMCYFRLGNAIHNDYRGFMQDLKLRVQNARENYNSFCTEADALVLKMLRTAFTAAAPASSAALSTSSFDHAAATAANRVGPVALLAAPHASRSRRRRSNIAIRPPVSQYLMLSNIPPSIMPSNNAADLSNNTKSNNNNTTNNFIGIYGYRFCEGYLLSRDRRKKSRLLHPSHLSSSSNSSQHWAKYYCRYDALTGQLMLRAMSSSSSATPAATTTASASSSTMMSLASTMAAAGHHHPVAAVVAGNNVGGGSASCAAALSIDADVDAKVLYVQQCCIHDPDHNQNGSTGIERRFCFDVYATEAVAVLNTPTTTTMTTAPSPAGSGGSRNSSVKSNSTSHGAAEPGGGVTAAKLVAAALRSTAGRAGDRKNSTKRNNNNLINNFAAAADRQSVAAASPTTKVGQTNMRILTFQATSNEDRNIWVRTMAESSQNAAAAASAASLTNIMMKNGTKHEQQPSATSSSSTASSSSSRKSLPSIVAKSTVDGCFFTGTGAADEESAGETCNDADDDNDIIDESGIKFIAKCIDAIEKRGLREQGLYRTAGVASRVTKLLHEYYSLGPNSLNLLHEDQWEVKTIASALKTFLRSLREPLMTQHLHAQFIEAAKLENLCERAAAIDALVQNSLPPTNRQLLAVIIGHLAHVVEFAQYNLMTAANLATCFGPTLMRPLGDTVAALVDIKFANVVVECLIDNFQQIFNNQQQRRIQPGVTAAAATSVMPNEQTPFLQQNNNNNFAVNYNGLALVANTSKTRRLKQQKQRASNDDSVVYSNISQQPQLVLDEYEDDDDEKRLSQSSFMVNNKDFILDDDDDDEQGHDDSFSSSQLGDADQQRPPSRLMRSRNVRYRKHPAQTVPLAPPTATTMTMQQQQPAALCRRQLSSSSAQQQQQFYNSYPHSSANYSQPKPQQQQQQQQQQPQNTKVDSGPYHHVSQQHQYTLPNNSNVHYQHYQQQQQQQQNFYNNQLQHSLPYNPTLASVAYCGAASSSVSAVGGVVPFMTPSTSQLVISAAESAQHHRHHPSQQQQQQATQQQFFYSGHDQSYYHSNFTPRKGGGAVTAVHNKQKSMPVATNVTTSDSVNGTPTNIDNTSGHHHVRVISNLNGDHSNIANRLRLTGERRGSDSPSQAEAQRRRWTTLILHPFDHNNIGSHQHNLHNSSFYSTGQQQLHNVDEVVCDAVETAQQRLPHMGSSSSNDFSAVTATFPLPSPPAVAAAAAAASALANNNSVALSSSSPSTDDDSGGGNGGKNSSLGASRSGGDFIDPDYYNNNGGVGSNIRKADDAEQSVMQYRKATARFSLDGVNQSVPRQYYAVPTQKRTSVGLSVLPAAAAAETQQSTKQHQQPLVSPLPTRRRSHNEPPVTVRRQHGGSVTAVMPVLPPTTPPPFKFTSGASGIALTRAAVTSTSLSAAKSTPSINTALLMSRRSVSTPGENNVVQTNNNDNNHMADAAATSANTTPCNTLPQQSNSTENSPVAGGASRYNIVTMTSEEDDDDSANAEDERRDSLSPPNIMLAGANVDSSAPAVNGALLGVNYRRRHHFRYANNNNNAAAKMNANNGGGLQQQQARQFDTLSTNDTMSSLSNNTLSSSASSVASLLQQESAANKFQQQQYTCSPAALALQQQQKNNVVTLTNIQEFQLNDI